MGEGFLGSGLSVYLLNQGMSGGSNMRPLVWKLRPLSLIRPCWVFFIGQNDSRPFIYEEVSQTENGPTLKEILKWAWPDRVCQAERVNRK